ncbi:Uncharacterised protein [Salmonella enterica subsp. enterica serovar Pullorum]|nr:Uncharacterised protein [Salmonella enterica subsp. enterica serovar Pullorum]
MKSQLVAAADRAAMSVAYGQEAADHYGIQYGFIRSVRDWITGFTEGIKGGALLNNTRFCYLSVNGNGGVSGHCFFFRIFSLII